MSFVAGVIVGGVIGGVAGVLWAPRDGAETRRRLLERADQARLQPEPAGTADELVDLALGVYKAAVERWRLAVLAARESTALTRRLLREEWERSKLGY